MDKIMTIDGYKTQEEIYWDFIKCMELTEEFELWFKAIKEGGEEWVTKIKPN